MLCHSNCLAKKKTHGKQRNSAQITTAFFPFLLLGPLMGNDIWTVWSAGYWDAYLGGEKIETDGLKTHPNRCHYQMAIAYQFLRTLLKSQIHLLTAYVKVSKFQSIVQNYCLPLAQQLGASTPRLIVAFLYKILHFFSSNVIVSTSVLFSDTL